MSKFKLNDVVYYVSPDEGVLLDVIKDNGGNIHFPFEIDPVILTEEGFTQTCDVLPSIFPATKEYRDLLVGLYGEEHVPVLPDEGIDLNQQRNIINIKKELESFPFVVCRVGNEPDYLDDDFSIYVCIVSIDVVDGEYRFKSTEGEWKYASPIDPDGVPY